MTTASVIISTLDLVAERQGDPAAHIYARLFRDHPELETLFHLDRDGGVRASMLQTSFECILDHVGPRLTSPGLIASSRLHHEGYGVPEGKFDLFFVAIRDTFRDLLGRDWTAERDAAWTALLQELAAIG